MSSLTRRLKGVNILATDPSAFSDWSDAFDIVPDAVLLIDDRGNVLALNPAARTVFDGCKPGDNLAAYVAGGETGVETIVSRLRGGSQTMPFTLSVRHGDDPPYTLKAVGKRLRKSISGVHFTLRVPSSDTNTFAALSLQIAELDSEVRARRIAQKAAEDSLEINRLLTRELHHRVNNNLQLQISLLRRSARITDNQEVRDFIDHAIGRLRAMSAGLDLTYRSGEAGVEISDLVEKVASQISETLPVERRISLQLDGRFSVSVPQVTPLALIIYETLTRIFVTGPAEGEEAEIKLLTRADDDQPCLDVVDAGQWQDVPDTGDPLHASKLIDTLARQAGVEVLKTDDGGRRLRLCFVSSAG